MNSRLVPVGLALVLAAVLGNGPSRDAAQARDLAARAAKRPARERVVGADEVRAAGRPGLELGLQRGFEVRLNKVLLPGQVVLRMAAQRARSDEIGAGFVPVGPTVELLAAQVSADVAFIADQFRVRAGHRLVLAVEQTADCASGAVCWQLVPARYERGRCLARGVRGGGRRLQFGSLPASATP